MTILASKFRHPRESGDPVRSHHCFNWIPACAGMTMLFLALLSPNQSLAQQSLPPAPYAYNQLEDPALEAEALELMETLRCLKCQSQSIADSDAPMAGDMRHQVRSRILAGEEPEAIRAWLVERYGDYVSYTPTVSSTTWPLFAIPLLLIGVAILVFRKRLVRSKDEGA